MVVVALSASLGVGEGWTAAIEKDKEDFSSVDGADVVEVDELDGGFSSSCFSTLGVEGAFPPTPSSLVTSFDCGCCCCCSFRFCDVSCCCLCCCCRNEEIAASESKSLFISK